MQIFEYLKDNLGETLRSIDTNIASLSERVYRDMRDRQATMEGNCEDRTEKIFGELSQQGMIAEARAGRLEKQVSSCQLAPSHIYS